jgi:transposase
MVESGEVPDVPGLIGGHPCPAARIDGGFGIRAIADRRGLARGTVRRFARAAAVEELLVNTGTGRRASLLEQFKPYLHQRWQEGCTNAAKLFEEITDRGYTGGPQILRAYLRPSRASGPDRRLPVPPSKPPSVRPVVGWIMSDPANLEPANHHRLDAILPPAQILPSS